MNILRTLLAILLMLWLVPTGTFAQDDLDLESLLSDLSDDTAVEEADMSPSTESSDSELLDAELLMLEDDNDVVVDDELGGDDLSDLLGDSDSDVEGSSMETASVDVDDLTDMSDEDLSFMSDDDAMDSDEDLSLMSDDDLLGDVDEETLDLLAETDVDSAYVDEAAMSEPEATVADDMLVDMALESALVDEGMVETADVSFRSSGGPETVVVEEVIVTAPSKATEFSLEEEVRRQALEVEGLKQLGAGFNALDAGRFEEAIVAFDDALAKIPERRATLQDRERAKWGHAEADYKLARGYYRAKQPDLEKAKEFIDTALFYKPDSSSAQKLERKIARAMERQAELKKQPVRAKNNPVVIERKKTVAQLLREGRDYYSIGDYNLSEGLFEKVLTIDEYNITAMRYLRKIAQKKASISDTAYKATKAKAMAKVRETWTPPITEEVQLPNPVVAGNVTKKRTDAERLQEKMAGIIIPKIEFRDANIQDVVDFLAVASQASDKDGVGVNIVLHLEHNAPSAVAVEQTSSIEDDPFGDGMWGLDDDNVEETFNAAPDSGIALTLNLHRISLLDAIKTITEIAGLRFRVDGNIVIITPQNFVNGQIITRLYPVMPTIIDVVVSKDDSGMDKEGDFVEMGSNVTVTRGDVKEFFERAGVPFPPGTSITYNSVISQLIVANTAENLEKFERILAQLNVIPNQVEIEARFIEIGEDDLRELGLEWILNDNWEVATKNGSGPGASQERVVVNGNDNGFTQGLRFFGYNAENGTVGAGSAITRGTSAAMGGILSISSILTNPQLSMVLHAMDQNGGTDLLSAPRVTARSGYNATIEVVREIIYPTEFDAQSQSVGTGAAESSDRTVVVVTPGSFETREVGVILNVTPTVGPDGYTIDLAMVPEVSELVGWIEYGSSIGDVTYHMPQPVFSSRNVTTSIVIWDGQTVVMGGMIREELTTVNDKIPLLGDIPFLGRLFRNEGEYSKKKNLLIFVTARLVDPAGKPIHKGEAMSGMPGAEKTLSDQSSL